MDKLDVLHRLIDLATGRVAHVSPAESDEMHEAVTPGYTTPPMSDDDKAKLAALQARADAEAAKNAEPAPAEAPAAPEPGTSVADADPDPF